MKTPKSNKLCKLGSLCPIYLNDLCNDSTVIVQDLLKVSDILGAFFTSLLGKISSAQLYVLVYTYISILLDFRDRKRDKQNMSPKLLNSHTAKNS